MAGAGSKRRDAKNTRSFITCSWEKALKPQNLVNAKSPANPKDERGVFRISVSSARAGEGPREAMRRAYTLQLGEGSETPKPGRFLKRRGNPNGGSGFEASGREEHA